MIIGFFIDDPFDFFIPFTRSKTFNLLFGLEDDADADVEDDEVETEEVVTKEDEDDADTEDVIGSAGSTYC